MIPRDSLKIFQKFCVFSLLFLANFGFLNTSSEVKNSATLNGRSPNLLVTGAGTTRTKRQNILRGVEELLTTPVSKKSCQRWKYSCFKNDTRISAQPFDKGLCDCDPLCQQYGECCFDLAVGAEPLEKKQRKKNERLICGSIAATGPGMFMVATCAPKFADTSEESLCRKKIPKEAYSYLIDIPVTSEATNLTYKNYYCALCNDDAKSLLGLQINIACDPTEISQNHTLSELLENAVYLPGLLTFKSRENQEDKDANTQNNSDSSAIEKNPYTCTLKLSRQNAFVRYCFFPEDECNDEMESTFSTCRKVIRQCDPSWANTEDVEICSSYSLRVLEPTRNIVYKNPHCAKCNFVNMSSTNLTCDISVLTAAEFGPSRILPPSFSILFNVGESQQQLRCPVKGEIWDPLHQKCSKVFCGDDFIYANGKCIYIKSPNSTSDMACPKVAIFENEFVILLNGSLYSKLNDKLYTDKNFEMYNETVAYVCIESDVYYSEFTTLHSYTTLIVLVISLTCLALHVIFYLLYARQRTWHGRNLLCLVCSLFVAQLLFLVGTKATSSYGSCFFWSVSLHYFWLVSFFWMNVLSIDVWRTFKRKFYQSANSPKIFSIYCSYAFGIPFLIVLIGASLDIADSSIRFRPKYVELDLHKLCWINSKEGLIIFFLLPVGIIVMENVSLFIMTSFGIYKQAKESKFANIKSQSIRRAEGDEGDDKVDPKRTNTNQNRKNKIRFLLYLKLALLQGLTWMLGFIAAYARSPVFWYIFTIVNGLQGAAIFLSFDAKKWIFISIWGAIASSRVLSSISKNAKTPSSTSSDENKKVTKKRRSGKQLSLVLKKDSKMPAIVSTPETSLPQVDTPETLGIPLSLKNSTRETTSSSGLEEDHSPITSKKIHLNKW